MLLTQYLVVSHGHGRKAEAAIAENAELRSRRRKQRRKRPSFQRADHDRRATMDVVRQNGTEVKREGGTK